MAPIDENEANESNIKDVLLDMTRELDSIKEPINDLTQDLILEKERIKQQYQLKSVNEEETKKLQNCVNIIKDAINTIK